ncbi:MAG: hypothetical protein K0R65_2582 [Crocinitomicaceae bacterium]|jgi:hypothetical protein|nr:hypothetical protein [Crocinitomicaceae bacterium]
MALKRRRGASSPKPPKKATDPAKKKKRRRILLGILVFLILARLALPYVILHFANKMLANMDGYYGHIDDIDISLYRGAYQIDDIYLKKVDKKDTVEFVDIKRVDLAIEWKAVFNGEIVGKVTMDSATVIFTKEKNEIGDIAKDTADLRHVINSFMPVRMNKLEVKNSYIRYQDPYTTPNLDMKLTDLHVIALNLVNGYDSSKVLPATIVATANVYGGKLKLDMKMDPYASDPLFDMNLRLENTKLVQLNDFMRAYANVDVNKGNFGLYTEMAAKGGSFNGYVKPLITDLDIVEFKKEEGSWLQIAYESLIGSVAWVFKNHGKDQLATKLYISGDMKDPKLSIGHAIILILKNAFISALKPSIDQEITLGSANEEHKTLLDKLFNKDDKKDEGNSKRDDRRQERKDKRRQKRIDKD